MSRLHKWLINPAEPVLFIKPLCSHHIFYVERCTIFGGSFNSNYVYDEDEGYYYCDVNLDEDDMYRFMKGSIDNCSFFSLEDEYKLARKQ